MSTKIKIEVYQEQGNETLIEFVETISEVKINPEQINKEFYTELMNNKEVMQKSILFIKKEDNDELLLIANAAYNFIRITQINDTDISSLVKSVDESDFENVDLGLFNGFHGSDISDYEGYCDCIESFSQDSLTSVEYVLGS